MPDIEAIHPGTYRVFLAHPKSAGEEYIAAWCDGFTRILAPLFPDQEVLLVSGVEEWDRYSASIGGFNGGWGAFVATAATPEGVPYHNAILVTPYARIGRGTAAIVAAAMAAGKPVGFGDPTAGRVFPVGRLIVHDTRDYVGGWEVAP